MLAFQLIISSLQSAIKADDREITAMVSYDRHNHPKNLTVTADGRRFLALPSYGTSTGMEFLTKVGLAGIDVSADGTNLAASNGKGKIDALALSKLAYPKTATDPHFNRVLRSKGGIAIAGRLLWLFSWDALETMGEPSSEVFAIEILKGADQSLQAGRVATIEGLGPHIGSRGAVGFGTTVIIVASGLSVFDIDRWKETSALTDGEGCVAGNQRIYWSHEGTVSRYDEHLGRFVLKASANLGELLGAYPVGGEDILVFNAGLLTPDSRSIYRFPGPSNMGPPQPFFRVGNYGLGLLNPYGFPSATPGILLAAHSLQPLAMIRRSQSPSH